MERSSSVVDAMPVEDKTTGTVYNLSAITTTQDFVSAMNKMATATTGNAIEVYTKAPMAFNAESVGAINNANKDFVYMFSYKGNLYKVTIPKGQKIDLGSQQFAGPLYIGSQFGTAQVIK